MFCRLMVTESLQYCARKSPVPSFSGLGGAWILIHPSKSPSQFKFPCKIPASGLPYESITANSKNRYVVRNIRRYHNIKIKVTPIH